MKKLFQKSGIAAAITLAGSLCLPSVGMADTYTPLSLWMINEAGERVEIPIDPKYQERQERLQERLRNFPCDPGYNASVAFDPTDIRLFMDQFDGGSARAPVWTDELGEVDLDQYTSEELAQMVRDFWTPERMKNAVPVELPSADGMPPPLQAGADAAAQDDDPVLVCVPSPTFDGEPLVVEGSGPAEGGK